MGAKLERLAAAGSQRDREARRRSSLPGEMPIRTGARSACRAPSCSPPLRMPRRRSVRATLGHVVRTILAGSAAIALPLVAPAQESTPPTLTLHGYFTRGLGASTGTPFYGLESRPTSDYGYAALQFRYTPDERNLLLLQVNHRRLGSSPINAFGADVQLNWAFYQRRFGDGTTVKAGRLPVPRGIYNEMRNIGVALPLYRAPVVFYDEGAYYSETVDGVALSRRFAEHAPWGLEAHIYGGGWQTLAYDTWSEAYGIERVQATHALGAQLWVRTPVEGLRLGLAGQRYRNDQPTLGLATVRELHASADLTREHGFLRAEAQRQDYGSDVFLSGYVQGAVRPTPRVLLVAELQRSRDTQVAYGDGTLPSSFEWHRSDGLGVNLTLSPGLVLKAEHHWNRGIQVEEPADPRTPPRFRYYLVSLSAAF